MEKYIEEVRKQLDLKCILLKFEYADSVSCKAIKYNEENFYFVGGDILSSIDGILKLEEKFELFKLNLLKGTPSLDEKYGDVDGRYYSKSFYDFKDGYLIEGSDSAAVQWKYDGGHLFIQDVLFKRGHYFIHDEPTLIGEMGHTTRRLPDSSILKEGEELWFWDDIRVLSGRQGNAIVKNGMAIASITTAMS